MTDIKNMLNPLRIRRTTIEGRSPIEEFFSDRSRILYSSSFRRLQQKAQVFSLEPNASIRSRLTHSLEVSDIGRALANVIGDKLIAKGTIDDSMKYQIISVVENACLLHDIGNPPFGHFGEAAIKTWAKEEIGNCCKKAGINSKYINLIRKDFEEFDGNPQGIRIVTRLHCENDQYGLNLSYPTILSCIKYTRETGVKPIEGSSSTKKAGHFKTEKSIIKKIYKEMKLNSKKRYPLLYIMEAADDISYALSDISDSIEKKLLSIDKFVDLFEQKWKPEYGEYPNHIIPNRMKREEDKIVIENFNIEIAIKISHYIVKEISDYYVLNYDNFVKGEEDSLLVPNTSKYLLKILKEIAYEQSYHASSTEDIELSGHAIITGLLKHFSKLLELKCEDFANLVNGDRKNIPEITSHLYNKLSSRCIQCYKYQLAEEQIIKDTKGNEWLLRAHLIVDYISGMTDTYALETYQLLQGIRIPRHC